MTVIAILNTQMPPDARIKTTADRGIALAVGDKASPLRDGKSVLWARGLRESDLTARQPRALVTPSLFVTQRGRLGAVAMRVDPTTDAADVVAIYTHTGHGMFDLVELPLARVGAESSAVAPAIDQDGADYLLSWTEPGGPARHVAALTGSFAVRAGTGSASPKPPTTAVDVLPEEADELVQALASAASATVSSPTTPPCFPFIEARADPAIMFWNGSWLFIATDEHFSEHPDRSGLLLRRAASIFDLTQAPDHRILGPSEHLQGCFWAPELHIINDTLWCFFAPSIDTTEWSGVQAWAMRLTSPDADPTAPSGWTEPQPVLDATNAPLQYDPAHPVISLDLTYFSVRGHSYLVWSQRVIGEELGDAELWIGEVDPSFPARLIAPAARLTSPEFSWETDGANVVEAPFAIVHGDTVYLTYSAAAVGPAYAVGLLTASIDADLGDPSSWRKYPYPLLDAEPARWGPGHSMFTRDENGQVLFVYHALRSLDSPIRDAGIGTAHFTATGRLLLSL